MTATLLRGNALSLPLADDSVDLIVTSPPYFGLRSYTDGGEHYAGQIGSEATPHEFLDALLAATAEMRRVLKLSGSIFVNLGDKYARPGGGADVHARTLRAAGRGTIGRRYTPGDQGGIPEKSLMLLPERYRIRCVDELGLIARAVIVWSKPNGLPESVTDRVRRSHEDWVHLTKEPRYYAAVDEIREPSGPAKTRGSSPNGPSPDPWDRGKPTTEQNPLGKLPGSVWTVATQPLTVPAELGVDHFAAFPMHWPRQLILGWSPPRICTECGEGRRPTSATELTVDRGGRTSQRPSSAIPGGPPGSLGRERIVSITGYACACPEPTAPARPAIVLDPFGGTGTAALVADVLGRHGISVDMSADYCRLARWRTTDPGQRAAAMQVDKPPAPPTGHEEGHDLLSLLTEGVGG